MDLAIPKKYIYISLALFAFNMMVAVQTYVPKVEHNAFYKLAYITFPVWGCVLVGSILGFVLMLFPSKNKDLRPEVKYARTKVIAILIVNAVFVLGYIYKMYMHSITGGNG